MDFPYADAKKKIRKSIQRRSLRQNSMQILLIIARKK